MAKTHWKECFNKDYIGAWFCMDEDKDLTIDHVVKAEEITGEKGRKDTEMVIYFEEKDANGRPLKMVANATNCKTLEKLTGSPMIEDWAGARITVWADPDVSFGGQKVGGIRIRPEAPSKLVCDECGSAIKGAFGMNAKQLAEYTRKKYGRQLCAECAKKAKEAAV